MKCRVCGCTADCPCDPRCAWESRDLCTTCARAVVLLARWWQDAYRPSISALVLEFRASRNTFRTKALAAAKGKR
jgi:hypothetical protein